MAKPALDELVSWSRDDRGRVTGFTGLRGDYPIDWLSRFLLPDLGSDFAEQGDVLEIEQNLLFGAQISGLTNFTRRRALSADPVRSLLCAAFIFALALPWVLRGRSWPLLLSGVAAAAFLHLLFNSRAAWRRAVPEAYAERTLGAWRILRSRFTGLPPGFEYEVREGPEPDWVALLDLAYANALADHEAVEIGVLPVPDGKLLACEPFQIHDPRRYAIPVPPGDYPVVISIAAAPETPDQRIAYAWVRLREGMPARWETARTRAGEDVSVGVDSGIAAFVSAAAARVLTEAYRRPDCDYVEPLSDAIVGTMDKVWRDTRGWAMLEVDGGGRLAAFSSGFGDGEYPVYRALDARGRRLAVAMVFFVDW